MKRKIYHSLFNLISIYDTVSLKMGYRGQKIEEKHHKITNIYGYDYN